MSCIVTGMILLVTALAKAQGWANPLQEALRETVKEAANLQSAVKQLQSEEFSAVIIDQLLLDCEPDEAEALFKHLGAAVPVNVNFAVNGMERIVREVRSALQRRKHDLQAAKREAEQALHHELKDTLTALLLSCDMALQVPELPASAAAKMRNVHELAGTMREKLERESA